MNIVDVILNQMQHDDEPTSECAHHLEREYELASEEGKRAINMALVAICGWSLPSLRGMCEPKPRARREVPTPPLGKASLSGSHGETLFDVVTGILDEPYKDEDNPEDAGFVRVDVDELRLAYGKVEAGFYYDVLEVAGWDGAGNWNEAEETYRDDAVQTWTDDGEIDSKPMLVYFRDHGREAARKYTASMSAMQA